MTALDKAKGMVGERETGGRNRSPFIDKINLRVGAPLGSPWCASFVSWAFAQSDDADGHKAPGSAGSQTWKAWAKKHGRWFTDPQKLLECKGALFGWTNPGGRTGHLGFVSGRLTVDGKVTAISTVEGNSNMAGSREGDGVVANRRDLKSKFWFIDTTGLKGGDFWQ